MTRVQPPLGRCYGLAAEKELISQHLTLSPLKPSYDGHSSGHFQKFFVHAVFELCARCRYQHMRIELLFHMVSLICSLAVRFVQ